MQQVQEQRHHHLLQQEGPEDWLGDLAGQAQHRDHWGDEGDPGECWGGPQDYELEGPEHWEEAESQDQWEVQDQEVRWEG